MSDRIEAGVTASTPEGKKPAVAAQSSGYVLFLLAGMYACHQLDRSIISVVMEPVKQEFGVSDTAMGLIAGLGYSLAFGVATIPIGIMLDRTNRVRLLACLLAAWSLLTLVGGFARSYVHLLLARIGVGAAEAGGQPTAVSLISDFFPAEKRSGAIGLLYLGSAIGLAASYLMGGYLTQEYGWRVALLVAGAPGLLLAFLLLTTVREPDRGASEREKPKAGENTPSTIEFLGFLKANPAMAHLLMGTMLASAVTASGLTWLPALLMRVHGMELAWVGVLLALGVGPLKGFAAAGGGWLAGKIAGPKHHRLAFVAGVATMLLTPIGVGLSLAPQIWLVIALILAFGAFNAVWLAPIFSLSQTLTPVRMRGRTGAGMQFAASVLGAGFGPFLVGVISDAIGGGKSSLGYAMACAFSLGLWAGAHFLLASRESARTAERQAAH